MRRCLAFVALALAACQEGPSHDIPLHDTDVVADEPSRAPSIVSLAHGGQKGPIPVNTELELAVKATDPANTGLTYTWSATGGTVEGQGERAVWRTPPEAGIYVLTVKVSDTTGASAETRVNVAVSSTISGDVLAFQGNSAPTTVESGRDQVGTYCSIDVDANRRPHITYYNSTHEQIRYAYWDGTQWMLRIVDGPGFNTGRAAGPASYVKVGADGHPRVAYVAGGGIYFAQWTGTTWQRTSNAIAQGFLTSLALNPALGQEPAVLYSQSSNTSASLFFAQRTSGSWSMETLLSLSDTSCGYSRTLSPGTLAFSPDGTAQTVAWNECIASRYLNSSNVYVYPYRGGLSYFERNPTTKAWANISIVGPSSAFDRTSSGSVGNGFGTPRLVRAGNGALAVATSGNYLDTTTNTFKPYSGLSYRAPGTINWQLSYVDSTFWRYDVGFTPDNKPVLTNWHDGLELVSTDSQGFWTYTYVGAVDSGSYPMSLAVDSAGQPHLCYSAYGALRYF
ncbi:PKD domain-containing protein [Archangium sp.]|uniref:PKD domain-containing protein n=1 Tax=Archangium sp. TaxID=1872627 RepID=UPI00286CE574|nr:PKD domain-containing protein [Archangium sp.]